LLRRAAECAEKEADVISYIYYDAGEAAPADGGRRRRGLPRDDWRDAIGERTGAADRREFPRPDAAHARPVDVNRGGRGLEGSALAEQTIHELDTRQHANLLILAVHTPDGETLYNPPHEHKVAPGSTLIVMAEVHGVQSMQRAFRSNVEA